MSVSEAVRACWEGITKVWSKEAGRQAETAEVEDVDTNESSSDATESFDLRMAEIQKALSRSSSQEKNFDALSAMETVSDAELAKLLGAAARQMKEEKNTGS